MTNDQIKKQKSAIHEAIEAVRCLLARRDVWIGKFEVQCCQPPIPYAATAALKIEAYCQTPELEPHESIMTEPFVPHEVVMNSKAK